MRVSFEKPYDYIRGRVHVSYPAGEHTVKREWGEEMVAAGVASEVKGKKASAENDAGSDA